MLNMMSVSMSGESFIQKKCYFSTKHFFCGNRSIEKALEIFKTNKILSVFGKINEFECFFFKSDINTE